MYYNNKTYMLSKNCLLGHIDKSNQEMFRKTIHIYIVNKQIIASGTSHINILDCILDFVSMVGNDMVKLSTLLLLDLCVVLVARIKPEIKIDYLD